MKESVGILIIAKNTNNFLLLHRVNKPIVWSILTGTMDVEGETPLDTIKREIMEEIKLNPNKIKNIEKVGTINDDNVFHLFVGFVDEELKLDLKLDENDDYGWYNETNLPAPIHKKWGNTFQLVKPLLNLINTFKKHIK